MHVCICALIGSPFCVVVAGGFRQMIAQIIRTNTHTHKHTCAISRAGRETHPIMPPAVDDAWRAACACPVGSRGQLSQGLVERLHSEVGGVRPKRRRPCRPLQAPSTQLFLQGPRARCGNANRSARRRLWQRSKSSNIADDGAQCGARHGRRDGPEGQLREDHLGTRESCAAPWARVGHENPPGAALAAKPTHIGDAIGATDVCGPKAVTTRPVVFRYDHITIRQRTPWDDDAPAGA